MTLASSRFLATIPLPLLASATIMVLVGDYLLFDRSAGVNIALFLAVFSVTAIWVSRQIHGHGRVMISSVLFAGLAVFALAENISWISVTLAIAGVSTLVVGLKTPWYRDARAWVFDVLRFVFSAPGRMLADVKLVRRLRARMRKSSAPAGLIVWVVPVVFTLVFSSLLALANPLMEDLLVSLFQVPENATFPAGRLLLWSGILLFIWPFYSRQRAKTRRVSAKPAAMDEVAEPGTRRASFSERLLSPQAIIRSLVLFNILFGLQTLFDFAFLWAGATLPDGMTYASYAHRGAYPLLFTVLLAAGFVLATMYKGSKSEHNKLVRLLVFVWVGQNILLTFSSFDRLWLYVSAYSLTYLRLAAFIWMGLVGFGLVLIIVRLWRGYSNHWLVNANLLSLIATLMVCGFVNFGSQIAWFNVLHSREVTGRGLPVDLRYLGKIGYVGLPAVRYLQQFQTDMPVARQRKLNKIATRYSNHISDMQHLTDWRELSLRDYRLLARLDTRLAKPPANVHNTTIPNLQENK